MAEARRQLETRDGLDIDTVLTQIEARPLQSVTSSDTLDDDGGQSDLPGQPPTDTDWRDDLAG